MHGELTDDGDTQPSLCASVGVECVDLGVPLLSKGLCREVFGDIDLATDEPSRRGLGRLICIGLSNVVVV